MKIIKSLVRVFPPLNDFARAVAFYEQLYDTPCVMKFSYVSAGLELAAVGDMLIIAGSEAALEPFRATVMTMIVDDIAAFHAHFVAQGVEIIAPIQQVPTGHNMRVCHPDGLVVEYVEHSPQHAIYA